MSEERASREGSSRRSGGSRDGHGDRLDKALGNVLGNARGKGTAGAAAETGVGDAGTVGDTTDGGIGGGEYGDLRPAAVPRQAPQGHPGGAGRRRAVEAEPFDAAEFAAALHESVSAIGASGPPRAGLARIRRRAKARQRRRTVMASSAGVLLLTMAVGVATGNSFDIVPVLTGVVGLGGSDSGGGSSAQTPGPAGVGQVRTVRPPADAIGKKGPAIGPVGTVAGTPAALAATGVPECTATDLTTVAMVDSVIGGVSYGHVEAVATATCAVAGPPVLKVQNAAGTAASSVVILQHMVSDGSQLPTVTTWGAVLKLQAGQGYDFQFAWAPDACVGAGSVGGATTGASPSTGASVGSVAGQPPASAYSLSYLVAQVTPTEPVDLNASCGATVYVTDVYAKGAYPLPKPPATASAQPPASSAPATSPAPVTQPPASSTAPVATTAPTTPSSSAGASTGASPSSGSTGGAAVASPGQPSNS